MNASKKNDERLDEELAQQSGQRGELSADVLDAAEGVMENAQPDKDGAEPNPSQGSLRGNPTIPNSESAADLEGISALCQLNADDLDTQTSPPNENTTAKPPPAIPPFAPHLGMVMAAGPNLSMLIPRPFQYDANDLEANKRRRMGFMGQPLAPGTSPNPSAAVMGLPFPQQQQQPLATAGTAVPLGYATQTQPNQAALHNNSSNPMYQPQQQQQQPQFPAFPPFMAGFGLPPSHPMHNNNNNSNNPTTNPSSGLAGGGGIKREEEVVATSQHTGSAIVGDPAVQHQPYRFSYYNPEPDSPRDGSGESGAGGFDSQSGKKARLVWTQELHNRFINALSHLGLKNAVPKNILTLMNVEGMTRENVASHLQKYRLYLKKIGGYTEKERIEPEELQKLHEQNVQQMAAQQAMYQHHHHSGGVPGGYGGYNPHMPYTEYDPSMQSMQPHHSTGTVTGLSGGIATMPTIEIAEGIPVSEAIGAGTDAITGNPATSAAAGQVVHAYSHNLPSTSYHHPPYGGHIHHPSAPQMAPLSGGPPMLPTGVPVGAGGSTVVGIDGVPATAGTTTTTTDNNTGAVPSPSVAGTINNTNPTTNNTTATMNTGGGGGIDDDSELPMYPPLHPPPNESHHLRHHHQHMGIIHSGGIGGRKSGSPPPLPSYPGMNWQDPGIPSMELFSWQDQQQQQQHQQPGLQTDDIVKLGKAQLDPALADDPKKQQKQSQSPHASGHGGNGSGSGSEYADDAELVEPPSTALGVEIEPVVLGPPSGGVVRDGVLPQMYVYY